MRADYQETGISSVFNAHNRVRDYILLGLVPSVCSAYIFSRIHSHNVLKHDNFSSSCCSPLHLNGNRTRSTCISAMHTVLSTEQNFMSHKWRNTHILRSIAAACLCMTLFVYCSGFFVSSFLLFLKFQAVNHHAVCSRKSTAVDVCFNKQIYWLLARVSVACSKLLEMDIRCRIHNTWRTSVVVFPWLIGPFLPREHMRGRSWES